MDAKKMSLVDRVSTEITKAIMPLGCYPDFSNLRDGKGAKGFSITISFGEKPKETNTDDLFEGKDR